jgi:YfiH family protein
MNADQWQWRGDVLTCELLSDWQHGFFTRSHFPKLPPDLHPHFAPEGKAFRSKQVHGNHLVHADEINLESTAPLPEADGVWVTANEHHQNHSVWVCTADCVPVLIGDRTSGSVAAVHAGWRGTASGIVTKAIATLCDQGSALKDLRVALGPAISGEVYQVSQEVAQQVTATIKEPVGLIPDDHPERIKLDLRQVQVQQLQELGLPIENIAIAPYCTLQSEEIFFSYRRYFLNNPNPQPRAPQIQWSGIAIG